MKADYGLTSNQLSDRLGDIDPKGGWTERKVTNALAASRTLPAENARQILKSLKPTAAQEHAGQGRPWRRYVETLALRDNSWLYRLVRRSPAAFVPPREAERLADLLASRLVQVSGISKRRRDKIASVIKSELVKGAPHMGELWLAEMTRVVVSGIAEAVQGGTPPPPIAANVERGTATIRRSFAENAVLIAPFVLKLAYELEFSKKPSNERRRRRD